MKRTAKLVAHHTGRDVPERSGGLNQRPERLRLPVQRSTSFQASSIYPWQIDRGLGVQGICIGLNVLSGGGFYIDPHSAYSQGLLENPNMLVLGDLGQGKSSLVKTILLRAIPLLGRRAVVFDPKREYGDVAAATGMRHLELRPGGRVQINPIARIPGSVETDQELFSRRTSLVLALLTTLDDHEMDSTQRSIVGWAMEALGQSRGGASASLHEFAELLLRPTPEMAARAACSEEDLRRDGRVVWERVDSFLHGQLAGMFDGRENSLHEQLASGPGIVLDLRSVFGDARVLSAVMLAAQSSLEAAYMAPTTSDREAPRTIAVIDEGWAITANELAARFTQRSFKLARSLGVSNVLVAHRLKDFGAAAADGSAAAKMAENLVNDTGIQVLYRASEADVAMTVDHLGLSEVEAQVLPKLAKARAVWRVRGRSALVDHIRSQRETLLTNTDSRLEVDRGQ